MLAALDQLAGVTSSTFLRLQADQVGPVLDDTLNQLVNLLDIDCASLSVCATGGKTFDVVHASARAGMSRSSIDDLHAVPWCAHQLLQGQPVVLGSLPADLPPDAREHLHVVRRRRRQIARGRSRHRRRTDGVRAGRVVIEALQTP